MFKKIKNLKCEKQKEKKKSVKGREGKLHEQNNLLKI
jgi:hypothetical protein